MNPDFVVIEADASVADALRRVRASELGGQLLTTVCLLDSSGVLVGTVSLPELIRADTAATLTSLLDAQTPTVSAEADLPEVAQLMTDYNLVALPVLDGDGHPVGMIAVDDVLERLLPEEWRRRSGAARQ
jgi:Mg/Co/Ni transporter MgtE